ncbi:hypothetical protein V2A60_009864 [Cordyceps javanica]
MRQVGIIAAFAASAAARGFVVRHTDDPERYTTCSGDRGYQTKDALGASDYVVNTLVFDNGRNLLQDECIYKRENTTIVSVCNGSARNRTITRDETKRGIDQLIKDCGADGAFSGAHVVNNLTFAAFGIFGGNMLKGVPGKPDPETPGGVSSAARVVRLRADDDTDPCMPMTFDGKERFDCSKPEGHTLGEGGVCGDPDDADDHCEQYCEVRRTGLIGLESTAPGIYGRYTAAGIQASIAEGESVSITKGFSIGVEGIAKEVIGAGVSFEWSIEKTESKTIEQAGETSDKYGTRWVFFAKFIESCGSVSRKKWRPGVPCPFPDPIMCSQDPAYEPFCEGEVETLENICSYTPYLRDGKPEVFWVQRFEDGEGNIVPLAEQTKSYQNICKEGGDPDRDGEFECKAKNE